jgi:tungstate transport system substrate-binding protein
MKKSLLWSTVLVTLISLAGITGAEELHGGVYGKGPHAFALATGSPGQLGLVKVLAEAFAAQHNATVTWKEAGSGESLKLLNDRAVDMIMVHAPSAEK